MTIGIVITLVGLLGLALIIAVAKEPGSTPSDVAIGYCLALARRDFDAMYRNTDPDVLAGRNRMEWIAERRGAPHAGLRNIRPVGVASAVETAEEATIVLTFGPEETATVQLVCRQRIWVVRDFQPASVP